MKNHALQFTEQQGDSSEERERANGNTLVFVSKLSYERHSAMPNGWMTVASELTHPGKPVINASPGICDAQIKRP